jgi:hypothetical protein
MYICDSMWPNFSLNDKCFRKSSRENQNTHFTFKKSPPPENRAIFEVKQKSMVEPIRLQMIIQYGACVLHVG